MSLLSDGIDDCDNEPSMGAVVPNKRKPTQQKSTQQKSGNSIGPDVPWMKILLWGTVSAGGIYVGHKIYKHYTAPKTVTVEVLEPVSTEV